MKDVLRGFLCGFSAFLLFAVAWLAGPALPGVILALVLGLGVAALVWLLGSLVQEVKQDKKRRANRRQEQLANLEK